MYINDKETSTKHVPPVILFDEAIDDVKSISQNELVALNQKFHEWHSLIYNDLEANEEYKQQLLNQIQFIYILFQKNRFLYIIKYYKEVLIALLMFQLPSLDFQNFETIVNYKFEDNEMINKAYIILSALIENIHGKKNHALYFDNVKAQIKAEAQDQIIHQFSTIYDITKERLHDSFSTLIDIVNKKNKTIDIKKDKTIDTKIVTEYLNTNQFQEILDCLKNDARLLLDPIELKCIFIDGIALSELIFRINQTLHGLDSYYQKFKMDFDTCTPKITPIVLEKINTKCTKKNQKSPRLRTQSHVQLATSGQILMRLKANSSLSESELENNLWEKIFFNAYPLKPNPQGLKYLKTHIGYKKTCLILKEIEMLDIAIILNKATSCPDTALLFFISYKKILPKIMNNEALVLSYLPRIAPKSLGIVNLFFQTPLAEKISIQALKTIVGTEVKYMKLLLDHYPKLVNTLLNIYNIDKETFLNELSSPQPLDYTSQFGQIPQPQPIVTEEPKPTSIPPRPHP